MSILIPSSALPQNKAILDQYWNPIVSIWYGSWFVTQAWYEWEKPVKDLIFWVRNSRQFHEENLEKNPWDYSSLVRFLWADFATWLQKTWWKIYYNPFINFWDEQIKYWVIELEDLINDLVNWETLYLAWRLHKPVEMFSFEDEWFVKAYRTNLESALRVALIMLWDTFTEEELYEKISRISYLWDSRNKKFENPKKVKNIVAKNMERFSELYWDIISESDLLARIWDSSSRFERETDWYALTRNLPRNLTISLSHMDHRTDLAERVTTAISWIVNRNSKSQTIKWLVTAWPKKSLTYVSEKWRKAKK